MQIDVDGLWQFMILNFIFDKHVEAVWIWGRNRVFNSRTMPNFQSPINWMKHFPIHSKFHLRILNASQMVLGLFFNANTKTKTNVNKKSILFPEYYWLNAGLIDLAH